MHDKKVLIDPKGSDYSKYTGAFLLTPNKKEAINIAYENIKKIKVFQDKNMSIENNNLVFFREDIGS